MRSFLLLFLSLSFIIFTNGYIFGQSGRHENPSQRSITIKNESRRKVDIFWVNNLNPRIAETFVSQSDDEVGYSYGADAGISSYVGHTFEIRELPGKRSGTCVQETCWKGRFVVNDEEKQEVILGNNFVMTHTDSHKRAQDEARKLLLECQESASSEGSTMDMVDYIAECMKQKTDEKIGTKEEEVQFQSQLRSNMAEELFPFACGDVNYTETEEGMNTTWDFEDMKYTVRVHHKRPSSVIVAIHDFIESSECQAVSNNVETDGKIDFERIDNDESDGTALHDLAIKLYSYTAGLMNWEELEFATTADVDTTLFYAHKDSSGLSLPEKQCTATDVADGELSSCKMPGQVPVPADTASFHIQREEGETFARVATAFLYCDKPLNDQLGGLHFPYAGVHIQPRPGMLVLAVHRHLIDDVYDGFVQEYHFCPNHQLYTHTFYQKVVGN